MESSTRFASTCFGSRGYPIERQANFGSEDASGECSRHASAGSNEKALAEPGFERRDLPADGAMGQPEFRSCFGIAGRSSGDLEDAQSVKRNRTAHSTREKNRRFA